MMKCENCESDHDGSYGSGRFCSAKCAHGFSTKGKRDDINKRVSAKLKGRKSSKHRWSIEQREKQRMRALAHLKKTDDALKCNKPFEEWPDRLRRAQVLDDQQGVCNRCGISEWNGQLIVFELEHKDGNHHNNSRENLEFLCPNCHSQTSTWRGRGKRRTKTDQVSDDVLLNALLTKSNTRQALLSVGLPGKGKSYIRCKRLLERYKMGQ